MKSIVLLLSMPIVATVAAAQSSASRPAVLRGFVLVDSVERPIAGAELTIADLDLRVRSEQEGAFRLAGIRPGAYIVSVRAVGYQRIWARLTFADGDSLERDFLLVPSPVAIAGVRVTGKSDSRNPKVAEFERRRAGGIGSFISSARIDSFPGRRLSNFVRELPGLSVQQGKTSTATWAVGARGSGSIRNFPAFSGYDGERGAKRGTCYSAVYLDGVAVYTGQPQQSLFDIDQLQPSEIAGIEYYAGAAQTPPELNVTTSGTCGILVIWTK